MYISVKVSDKTVNAEKRFIYHQHNWLPYAISHILLHVLLMLGHESVRVRTNYLAMKEVDVDEHNFCPTDTKLDQERRQPESTLTYSLELPPSPPTKAREGERGVSKQAPCPAHRQDEGLGLEQDHPPASW